MDVLAIAVQDDGKILLGGYIEDPEMGIEGLIRLNADGSLDRTFTSNLGVINGQINSVVVSEHADIWIGGAFDKINGYRRDLVALLTKDGILNHAFNAGEIYTDYSEWDPDDILSLFNRGCGNPDYLANDNYSPLIQIQLQQDGSVVIYGSFNRINDEPVTLAKLRKNTTSTTQVAFSKTIHYIPEDIGTAEIELERSGNTESVQTLQYLINPKEVAILTNFESIRGEIVFQPFEIRKQIRIPIQDDQADSQSPLELEITLTEPTNTLEISAPKANLFILDSDREGAGDSTFQPALSQLQPSDIRTIQTIDRYHIEIGGWIYPAKETSVLYNEQPSYHRLVQLTNEGALSEPVSEWQNQPPSELGDIVRIWPITSGNRIALTTSGYTQYHLVRLSKTGDIDSTFEAPSFSNVEHVLQTVNGDSIVTGKLDTVSNQPSQGIAKLDASGRWVESFIQNIHPVISHSQIVSVSVSENQLKVLTALPVNSTVPFNTTYQLSHYDLNGNITSRIALRKLSSESIQLYNDPNEDSTYLFGSFKDVKVGSISFDASFKHQSTISTSHLIRLQPDGTPDTSFQTNINGPVHNFHTDAFSRLYIAGEFDKVDGILAHGLARLNHDGTLDTAFDAGVGVEGGAVHTMTTSQDGRGLYIGGTFTSYDQIPLPGLARIKIAPYARMTIKRPSDHGPLLLDILSQPETHLKLKSSTDLQTWTSQWTGKSERWNMELEITPKSTVTAQFYRMDTTSSHIR